MEREKKEEDFTPTNIFIVAYDKGKVFVVSYE